MPGSACTITEYKGRFVPAFPSGINRTISSYIFCLQSIHLSFSPSMVLQQYIQSMKSVKVNPPRFTRSFGLVCLASLFLSSGDVIWRIWSSLYSLKVICTAERNNGSDMKLLSVKIRVNLRNYSMTWRSETKLGISHRFPHPQDNFQPAHMYTNTHTFRIASH